MSEPWFGGVHRDHAGEQPPADRRELRHAQVVRVGRVLDEVPPVEVDDRGRRQRVQLAAAGRHRRREDRRDHQPDEADRHPRRDEGRKHVVDVVVALVAGRLLDDGRRPARGCRCTRASLARNASRSSRVGGLAARRRSPRRTPAASAAYSRRVRARRHLRVVGAVEQHRRRLEQVEDEHQHAGRRISSCSGILTNALISSDCRASSIDFAVR